MKVILHPDTVYYIFFLIIQYNEKKCEKECEKRNTRKKS